MRSYFDARQLVEITALLTLVNLDRFNAAFGIGSAASAKEWCASRQPAGGLLDPRAGN